MDDGLKQRLVGAIVLVAVAVIFLPTLLDRDARRTVDLSSQIPAEPAVVTEIVEIAEPVPPQDIPVAKPLAENYPHEPVEPQAGATAPGTDGDQAAPAAETPSDNEMPARDIGDVDPPALNADGVPDGWSLQVASFKSPERADAMLKELQAEGFKSYVRSASTTQGKVHRVFVGPKINRAAAEAEKRRIDQRFNTKALVVEFKP